MTRFDQTKAHFSFARIFGFLCAVVVACMLAFGIQTATSEEAFADDAQSTTYKPTTYTVTLYAGNGTIEGGAEKVYSGIESNGNASCNIDWRNLSIQPDSDKYYVKGIRLAGHDELFASGNFPVTEDMQFVVAYGMKKDQVAYTINYVDANGTQIADSETFYGNIGDKPVIAYRYIEGYQPSNAYNQTGTLDRNAENNVFTFEYQAVQGSSEGAANGGAAAGATDEQGTSGDENANDGEATDEGQTADDATNAAEPAELLDIDDTQNPLASAQNSMQETFSNPLNYLPWVLGVLVVIALISVIALMVAKKRHAKENQ